MVGMWRAKLVRQFPVFFAYLVEEVLQFLVLYPMSLAPSISGAFG